MSVKRITSKKPYRLIEDNDGHEYLIPLDLIDEFWCWVQWEECNQDGPYEGLDFNQFIINGSHTLKIYSWAEDV